MKKLVLSSVFIVLLALSSFAQLEKGSWIGGINGNVGFNFSKSSSYRVFSASINPYAMYLLSKNFALGLNLDNRYSFSNVTYNDGLGIINYSSNKLLLAPLVRIYFGNGRYRPYAGVATGLAMNHSKINYFTSSDVSKSTGFGYFLNPEVGISYWLNDKVFFDLKTSYDLINYNMNGDYHNVDLKIGIGIKIGNSAPKE